MFSIFIFACQVDEQKLSAFNMSLELVISFHIVMNIWPDERISN